MERKLYVIAPIWTHLNLELILASAIDRGSPANIIFPNSRLEYMIALHGLAEAPVNYITVFV